MSLVIVLPMSLDIFVTYVPERYISSSFVAALKAFIVRTLFPPPSMTNKRLTET